MSIQLPVYRFEDKGWRGSAFILLVAALSFGLPSALLSFYGLTLGELPIPLLPSGIAFMLLVAFGWRALPGVAAGGIAVATWCLSQGSAFPEITAAGWFLLFPLGACSQSAVTYRLASRVSPNLIDTSSHWEFSKFSLFCVPAGSLVGALFAWVAIGPGAGLPFIDAIKVVAIWWCFDIALALGIIAFWLGFHSNAPRPFLPLAMLSAVFGILLGLTVILGWLANNTVLIRLNPALAPMAFNAAVCFVLSGSGLLALVLGWPRIARMTGLVLIFLGSLTYLQYIFKVELGIDEMFFVDLHHSNPDHPGRMSAGSALCFLLYGLALSQRFGSRGNVAASTLFSFVASIGAIRFVSHIADIDTDYGWAEMSPMALHTAGGWIMLGLGGLAREVLRGEGTTRRVFLSPVPTGVALAAISVWIWQAAYHEETETIRNLARERASDITRIIEKEITYHNNTMLRMASRWDTAFPYSHDEWTRVARLVLKDFTSVAALAWADSESCIRWLEPMDDSEDIIGFQLSAHPHGAEVLAAIHESGKQLSSDVIRIRPIGKGFIMFTPVTVKGKLDGYVLGLYRLDKLFQVVSSSMRNYRFRVFEGEQIVFESEEGTDWPVEPAKAVHIERKLRGDKWKLELVPKPEWLARQRSNLPTLILFTGLFLSFIATYALHLLQKVRGQYDTIQLNENRLRQVFDCAPTGLITTDRYGIIEDLNPEAQRQFGYTSKELSGKSMEVLVPGHFSEAQIRERLTAATKEGCGQPEMQKFVALNKSGAAFPVEVAITPYQTREGVQILALVTDISERDEARRKLLAYTRALESTNKDLDDFAYVASHDLRAPLTAIGSLVAWLEEDAGNALPENSLKHLRLIKNRVARMGKLLEDLLDYSRAGRTANALEMVDMEEIVTQVVDLLRDTRPLEVRTGELPVFETVRTPFHQILRNLVANALKHHDRDSCLIEITAEDTGEFYTIRVADDGPGIPPQFHDKVFNMFQTLRPRDEVEGSGMGLALVRKLVERYGGKVALVAPEKRGTCVEFTWPKKIKGG